MKLSHNACFECFVCLYSQMVQMRAAFFQAVSSLWLLTVDCNSNSTTQTHIEAQTRYLYLWANQLRGANPAPAGLGCGQEIVIQCCSGAVALVWFCELTTPHSFEYNRWRFIYLTDLYIYIYMYLYVYCLIYLFQDLFHSHIYLLNRHIYLFVLFIYLTLT